MKPFIGIKKLWYTDPISDAANLTSAKIATLVASATEIKNSHEGTFQYTQDDPEVTDYINELTGKPYYRDMTSEGNKTITFTIGEYEFATKAALQGGTVLEDGKGWKAPDTPELIYKAIIGQTKTGGYVVFTYAGVVGKTEAAEKNLGLGVSAVAMDNPTSGIADEYWFFPE